VATWADLTVTGAQVKARNAGDFPGLADGAIPPTAERMKDAKRILRTELVNGAKGLVASYPGGAPAMFDALADAADENEAFGEDMANGLVAAYRFVAYDAGLQTGGDRFDLKREGALTELRALAKSLATQAPGVLAGAENAPTPTRARGRGKVSVYDLGNLGTP